MDVYEITGLNFEEGQKENQISLIFVNEFKFDLIFLPVLKSAVKDVFYQR